MIKLAEKKDAMKIAAMHKKEISGGFLSSLPVLFLEKIYLSIIERDICVVAKEKDELVGFVAGTKNIKMLYGYFSKKYFFYSIFVFLPKLFNIRKVLEDVFYIKKEEISAELLTIAVDKNFQGKGIAKEMFDFFAREMSRRGVKEFKVVVGEKLKPAIGFYERVGFKFLRETEVHKGQKSLIYTYNL